MTHSALSHETLEEIENEPCVTFFEEIEQCRLIFDEQSVYLFLSSSLSYLISIRLIEKYR